MSFERQIHRLHAIGMLAIDGIRNTQDRSQRLYLFALFRGQNSKRFMFKPRSGLTVIPRNVRNDFSLRWRQSDDGARLNQIVRVFVMIRYADKMSDVMKQSRGFKKNAALPVQSVNFSGLIEDLKCDPGNCNPVLFIK